MALGVPLRVNDVADAGRILTVNQFFPYRACTAYFEAPRTPDQRASTPLPDRLACRDGLAGCFLLSQGIGGTSAG